MTRIPSFRLARGTSRPTARVCVLDIRGASDCVAAGTINSRQPPSSAQRRADAGDKPHRWLLTRLVGREDRFPGQAAQRNHSALPHAVCGLPLERLASFAGPA